MVTSRPGQGQAAHDAGGVGVRAALDQRVQAVLPGQVASQRRAVTAGKRGETPLRPIGGAVGVPAGVGTEETAESEVRQPGFRRGPLAQRGAGQPRHAGQLRPAVMAGAPSTIGSADTLVVPNAGETLGRLRGC